MKLEDAIKKVEDFSGLCVSSALDIGHSYVFSLTDKTNGDDPDDAPLAIEKGSGEIKSFFPPDHLDELNDAEEILWMKK